MQIMAGLEPPTEGEVWFDGANVTGTAVQKRNVSMVYQQFINYPMMNVFENIASPLRVGKLPENEIKKRVGEMSELLRISPMLDRKPSELSGGQQQRVAIGRTLAARPALVLADEPTGNLDEATGDAVMKLLLELVSETGAGLLMVTHSKRLAGCLDRQVHLHAGIIA